MTIEVPNVPIDPISTATLASRGLRFEIIPGDADAIEDFNYAVARGFLESNMSPDGKQIRYDRFFERRNSGVFDDTSAEPRIPVGTINTWITDLTVPGERTVPAWAISAVTVAASHRRRGIASALLTAELRTAASLGVPVAMLTVSEATIYGRWGFAPSAMAADWTIETRRARWTGPTPGGRIHFVPSAEIRDGVGMSIVEKTRLATPGQIEYNGHLWFRAFGIPGKPDFDAYRVARYDDESGEPQGFVIYKNVEKDDAWSAHVHYLVAATDDAYSALWRYLFELDLVTTVQADLRSIDEPFLQQIWDVRAARKTGEGDHLWTRILDPRAALEARSYSAAGVFALEVSDHLGFASGTWILDAATGVVTASDDIPSGAHHLRMSVNELSAIYLGGVSVATLVGAGRIEELTEGAAVAADSAFRSPVTPWLSIWF